MKSIGYILTIICFLYSFTANANWQCYAMDKGGHRWMSEGLTQENANAVALSFCSSFSPDSSTCQPSTCENKE